MSIFASLRWLREREVMRKEMNRKVLATLLSLIIAIALIAPVAIHAAAPTPPPQSQEVEVPTRVNVISGGGDPPVVKAKWELPDDDPNKPGTQIFPPLEHGASLTVEYYAVVTDQQGIEDIDRVYVDVYHPDGTFKYQVQLYQVEDVDEAIAMIEDAADRGIITLAPNFTVDDLIHEVEQYEAKVFKGEGELSYHQPYGNYTVRAYAYDQNNGRSEYLNNTFEYIRGLGFEIDFTEINFGDVEVCKDKWVSGDTVWGPPDPTIRNIGNTPAKINVSFDDMGFGMTNEDWNVEYDARLDLFDPVVFDPYEEVQLPGTLDLCTTTKISFSIHVKKGEGTHTGTMTISAVPA